MPPLPPIGDILHRGIVLTCVGVSAWGCYAGYSIHKDTMRRGEEALKQRQAQGLSVLPEDVEAERKMAEAAQAALTSHGKS